MKLYITPQSILTLVTWVTQSRLAFGHSARRLAIQPPALAKPNPTVCSLACRWRLRAALRADQESFSIETHPICLIVRPYADNSDLSYTTTLSYTMDTILERKQPVNESRLLTSGALPMQEPQASQPTHSRRDGPREGWGS